MKRYLKIYLISDKAYILKNFQARLGLLLQLTGSLCFLFMHLFSYSLFLNKFKLPTWSTSEAWIFLATFEIYVYSCFHFLNRGIRYTVRDINRGTLDIILAKPVNSRFLSFWRGGSINNLAAITTAIITLIYILFRHQILPHPINILLYIIFLATNVWLLHCLSIFFVVPNFYSGNLKESETGVFAFQEIYKYPTQTYDKAGSIMNIITIPFSLLVTIPASIILSKSIPTNYWIIYLTILIILSVFSNITWKKGLRNYTSAS